MRSAALAEPLNPPRKSAVAGLRQVSVQVGATRILDGIDLEVSLAGRTVILGPNGAGKSTLLHVLHGLRTPESGRVSGIGTQGEPVSVRSALVFQRPVMLRRSVLGNIEHALNIAGVPRSQWAHRAQAALESVDLSYATQRPARSLSGGEQQRLAIARAQALAPDCLLLDEPTASLDPAAGAAVERHLGVLSRQGFGLVMCTHDLTLARRFAQHVVLMHRGRIIEVGEAARFFDAPLTEQARRFVAGEWLDQT